MILAEYDSSSAALSDLAKHFYHADESTLRPGVRENYGNCLSLRNPARRFLTSPGRLANPIAMIVETAWVLSGRNDLDLLGRYLPRAVQFSDDGETWRAGYGPRLVGQLDEIVKLLRDNPSSRQAVATIWRPELDLAVDSKDIPCNNWLNFQVQDPDGEGIPQLNLYVTTRSNDLIWGWSGINQFEWNCLLEIVAELVGVNVGSLTFFQSNLHVYERHWPRLQDMFDYEDLPGYLPGSTGVSGNIAEFFQGWLRNLELVADGSDINPYGLNTTWGRYFQLLLAYHHPTLDNWQAFIQGVEGTDLEWAATDFFTRKKILDTIQKGL